MNSRTLGTIFTTFSLLAAGACSDADPAGVQELRPSVHFDIVSGDGQSAPAGTELGAPLVVKVTNASGAAVAGQIVNFVVTEGGGTTFSGKAMTNAQGIAQERWTLGPTPGSNTLEVRAVDSSTGEKLVFGVFKATGTDGTTPPPPPPASGTVGEVGRVTVAQSDPAAWHTVTLSRSYTNPVVVMGPPTYNGANPLTVRVRNVAANRFEFQLDEWEYLDGAHGSAETLAYLVVEAGSHSLADGTPLVAGVAGAVDHNWATVPLSGFTSAPVVFAQLASVNGGATATTRLRGVGAASFQVRLQEQSAADGTHADEVVHWVALGRTLNSGILNAWSTDGVTGAWRRIEFAQAQANPVFLAAMQTFNGSDPATLRYRGLTASGVDVHVQEEQSVDAEVAHAGEVVGYAVFGAVGPLTASSGSATARPAGAPLLARKAPVR